MNPTDCTFPQIMDEVPEQGLSWALDCVFRTFNQLVAIDPNQSWKQILHDATEIIVDFLEAEAATIRIQEPQFNRMITFGSYHLAEGFDGPAVAFEDTIAARVIATEQSETVEFVATHPDYPQQEPIHPYGAMMTVPLTIERFAEDQADVPGAILLYYAGGVRRFDPMEVRIAEMLAQRVSYVLARKRIIDMRRVNEKKEWLVEKLFSKISLDKGVKMKELFEMMAEELVDIIRIQSCSLFTVTPDGSQAVLETGWPHEGSYHTVGKVFGLESHPYLRAAVEQDHPFGDFKNERIYPSYLLIKHPQKSGLTTEGLRSFAREHDIHSILYVPLRIGDRVRHLLVFDALERRRFFSDEDIEILTFFGKELTQALEIERLDDILHDFKNPAIAVAGFARRVRRMLQENDTDVEAMTRYMDVIIHEGTRLQEMAMSLYPLARPETIDLAEVARDRFLINREAVSEQRLCGIRLDETGLVEGVRVTVPRLALERVLDNLLNNATKAIPHTGGELSVRVVRDEGRGWVEITNTGRIPEEELARLSSDDVTGRGLNIVHRFVRTMGGKVEVETGDERTRFRIGLPLSS